MADQESQKTAEVTQDQVAPPNSQSQSKLLNIAPELRNRIYRTALLESDDIAVDPDYTIPTLLQVCRKIRSEASSIYFLEQSFRIDVTNFDSDNYAGFLHICGALKYYEEMASSGNLKVGTESSTVVWEALLIWLERFFKGEMPGCRVIQANRSAGEKAASRAFRLVEKMRGKMEWEDVEKVLIEYRDAVEDAGDGWWAFQDSQDSQDVQDSDSDTED